MRQIEQKKDKNDRNRKNILYIITNILYDSLKYEKYQR